MKRLYRIYFGIFLLASVGLFSCEKPVDTSFDELPYFDLEGFMEMETNKIDGVKVLKTSRVEGKEEKLEKTYSTQDWKDEFEVFFKADINKPSTLTSYDTQVDKDMLIHELYPNSKGKIKFIKVHYVDDHVSRLEIKTSEKNLFYSSVTLGAIYMNNATHEIDHYSIETTQKIWFLAPNNMRISGVLK